MEGASSECRTVKAREKPVERLLAHPPVLQLRYAHGTNFSVSASAAGNRWNNRDEYFIPIHSAMCWPVGKKAQQAKESRKNREKWCTGISNGKRGRKKKKKINRGKSRNKSWIKLLESVFSSRCSNCLGWNKKTKENSKQMWPRRHVAQIRKFHMGHSSSSSFQCAN